MARISAIITDFQRNIRKAQRMAKTEIPDEIETQVDALNVGENIPLI